MRNKQLANQKEMELQLAKETRDLQKKYREQIKVSLCLVPSRVKASWV